MGSDVVGLLVFSVLLAMLVLFLSVEHFPAPPQSSMSLVRGCAQVQRGTLMPWLDLWLEGHETRWLAAGLLVCCFVKCLCEVV